MSNEKNKANSSEKISGYIRKTCARLYAGLAAVWKKIDWKDPSWKFLAVIVVFGLFLMYQMLPKNFLVAKGTLMKTTIDKQKEAIKHLDQDLDTARSETFYIDTIDFPEGNELRHAKLGLFYFSNDFFTTIEGEFEALIEGDYTFIVKSDDGFRLTVDKDMISEFTNDRPMAENEGSLFLAKGRHSFILRHFQGFGQLGLQAWYTGPGMSARSMMGADSSCLRFIPWQESPAAERDTPETAEDTDAADTPPGAGAEEANAP